MDEHFWISVVSGEDKRLRAQVLRRALSMAEPAYAAAAWLRNRSYDCGWLMSENLDVPVVSVGNLTTGGTGKTPTVAWLVNECRSLGITPGIISRGYRTLDGNENDEKRLLDELCPGVPHVQDRDRVRGGREAIERHGCRLLIADDGFQHRRLGRDLDIVLIDTLNPWGYGHLLPRGLLRESPKELKRAAIVLLTRCDHCDAAALGELRRLLLSMGEVPVVRTRFAPVRLVDHTGNEACLDELATRSISAFCGIGNPEAFRRTVAGLGAELTDDRFRPVADHYHYLQTDLDELARWADRNGTDWLITTRKDLVKIPHKSLGGHPVWGLDIGLEFIDPSEKEELRAILRKLAGSSEMPHPTNEIPKSPFTP